MRYTWRTAIGEVLMLLLGLAFAFPLVVLVITAFKPADEFGSALSLPVSPTLQNFADAWGTAHIGPAMLNSLLVTGGSTLVIVLTCSMASYPLARITKAWSRGVYALFMLGLILPFQLGLIPLYMTMRDVGLLGSPVALILLYAGLQAPFAVFLYTEHLRAVPTDYEQAASLDGCTHWQTFWHVVFPMLRPITGTIVILTVVFVWNDFYTPLLYLTGSGTATLPVALFQFAGQFSTNWNLVFAGLVLGSLPIIIAFLVMQRSAFRGYATGMR
ncbi:MAG: carbohydrate ABC transporter permease [Microbacteriaceae bacterium]